MGRVVVLGGGATAEAFCAAYRAMDEDSTMTLVDTASAGSVARSAALSTRRVAASSSRIATEFTDVFDARASLSNRSITSSGTLRKCRIRITSAYPECKQNACTLLAATG